MATDENSVVMTAVCRKASGASDAKGAVTYKLSFAYPPGFITYVCAMLGEEVELYWDGNLIAHIATCVGARQKPVKDSDPDFLVDFDAAPGDATLENMGAHAANGDSGELRVVSLQLALFPSS